MVDHSAWSSWWRYNGQAYLPVDQLLLRAAKTGKAYNAAGVNRGMIQKQVLPALEAVVAEGGDLRLLRETLISMARIRDVETGTGMTLDWICPHHLRGESPELQEVALIAYGVRGRADDVDLLASILMDDEAGRDLTGSDSVPVRARAFAAYSLGLIGSQATSEEDRLTVVNALLNALGNERSSTREIQVASVLSVGLVDLEFCGDDPERLERHEMEGDKHLCGGVQLRFLLDVFRDDDQDPWLRAHTAPSLGRLGQDSPADFRTAVVSELSEALDARNGAPDFLRHGSAIGLGLVADNDEDELDKIARDALARESKKGDNLGRRLALIGLARAAGREGEGEAGKAFESTRKYLLRRLARARGDEKAWAALSLSVLGHGRMDAKHPVDADTLKALQASLARAKDPAEASAIVVGLGVLRQAESVDAILGAYERIEDDQFRGFAAMALGLIDAREAREQVAGLAVEVDDDPERVERVAIGLRLLGDRGVTDELLRKLDDVDDEAREALVRTLGVMRDPAAVTPLVAMVADAEQDAGVRAAAASALGRMCDPQPLPWMKSVSRDLNYGILTWTLESPFADGSGLLELR